MHAFLFNYLHTLYRQALAVCVRICSCVRVCVYVCVCVCVHMCLCPNIRVCLYLFVFARMCAVAYLGF